MTNQATENRKSAKERAEQHHAEKNHEDAAVRSRLDRSLEQGLEDSFPASDAISVTQPRPSAQDMRGRKQHGHGG